MNSIKKHLPYYLTIAIVTLMVFASELFQEKEIIFPEIVALTIGAWLAPKQPWKTDKKRIVILITISAIIGIIIVRYIPGSLLLKVLIGFMITIILIAISKTTFMPLISACILPIIMNTESIIYPISVLIMSLIIIVVQYILQKLSFTEYVPYVPINKPLFSQMKKWAMIFISFSIVAILPIINNHPLFIAPPLIVMFVELSNPLSQSRANILPIYLQIICIAMISALICRISLSTHFIYSKTVASIIVGIILLLVIKKTAIFFPPTGAIAFLPFILPKEKLVLYPLEITIGAGLLILIDIIVFPNKKINM